MNTNWWAPVWRGLVVDPEAKHYRRMKNALWLFLYLVLHADRRTGKLSRKYRTIASEMGISPGTVRKWLRTLRQHGYVRAQGNGRCLRIEVNLWKTPGEAHKQDTQSGQGGASIVSQMGHSPGSRNSENPVNLSQEFEDQAGPNDISIKRDILKNDIEDKNFLDRFASRGATEQLALDLAEALNDMVGLPFYRSCAKRYPDELLRQTLSQVMEIPEHMIKRSRAALFNFLVRNLPVKKEERPPS
jgi:hypothetical protein